MRKLENTYKELCVKSLDEFLYGRAPKPCKMKNGMVIGGGEIYPEINFTLPPMVITNDTMPEVRNQYTQIINGVLQRAVDLHQNGTVIEVELLPDMTYHPEWGIEIHKIVRDAANEYEKKYGLKCAIRITPNDTRETRRPPFMRHGEYFENMMKTFEGCAKGGADFLSIESTGGKELNDDALVNADINKVIFSLGVLGVRDMEFLWKHLVDISNKYNIIPGGDSACGFANTAMVLAERKFIPRIFASVVRVATVPRALVAYQVGAYGPSKDCAYEGPYIKAITGAPIAMEGKSASCAHLSPIGNVAAVVADLWSNESVANTKLLSDMAPTVSMEQLIYDCRLMNEASRNSNNDALKLRDWLANSDSRLDPQAYVLRPDFVYDVSKELIKEPNYFLMTKKAVILTIEKLRKAIENNEVSVDERDTRWLDIMKSQVDMIPDDEMEFYEQIKPELDFSKFIPEEYGLTK